jgi:hypothetical protein
MVMALGYDYRMKSKRKREDGFENFSRLLKQVANVPHSEIKAKLEEERKGKKSIKRPTSQRQG